MGCWDEDWWVGNVDENVLKITDGRTSAVYAS